LTLSYPQLIGRAQILKSGDDPKASAEFFSSAIPEAPFKAVDKGLDELKIAVDSGAYGSAILLHSGLNYTYILIFALYMAILIYGQFAATSVATEKSSRRLDVFLYFAYND
jgi:hypothetical protein